MNRFGGVAASFLKKWTWGVCSKKKNVLSFKVCIFATIVCNYYSSYSLQQDPVEIRKNFRLQKNKKSGPGLHIQQHKLIIYFFISDTKYFLWSFFHLLESSWCVISMFISNKILSAVNMNKKRSLFKIKLCHENWMD